MSKKKKKINNNIKLKLYEINETNNVCKNGGSHLYKYVSQHFGNKVRLVLWCARCDKLFVDKQKFKVYRKTLGNSAIFMVTPTESIDVNGVIQDLEKKETKPIMVYMYDDINYHECLGTPNIVVKSGKLKNSKINIKIHYCETCNKYICNKNNQFSNINLSKIIRIVDKTTSTIEKQKQEDAVEKYIKNNFNDFIVQDNTIIQKKHTDNSISNDDFFSIVDYIKRNNIYDFMIKGSTFRCTSNNHKIIEMAAKINVVRWNGDVIEKECPVYYCQNCNVSFILNTDYDRLRSLGAILCKIYDSYKFFNDGNNSYVMDSESIMHSFGYNVNSNDNLTSIQRQTILISILNNNIMSKWEMISHISYLINRSRNLKSFSQARRRWNEDIEFLNDYKVSNYCIEPTSITKIHYIKK